MEKLWLFSDMSKNKQKEEKKTQTCSQILCSLPPGMELYQSEPGCISQLAPDFRCAQENGSHYFIIIVNLIYWGKLGGCFHISEVIWPYKSSLLCG